MATNDIQPMRDGEPQLNLLLSKSELDQPLWKSLVQNLDDFFFPKKQPPLVLTSKPIPVRDIWGFYDYKKNGVLGSTLVHVLAVIVIIVMAEMAMAITTSLAVPIRRTRPRRPRQRPRGRAGEPRRWCRSR